MILVHLVSRLSILQSAGRPRSALFKAPSVNRGANNGEEIRGGKNFFMGPPNRTRLLRYKLYFVTNKVRRHTNSGATFKKKLMHGLHGFR
jgi:hypothetical protein